MIPIRLTLSGIYSYQQAQTIDFTRLTQSSIFGIFGMVGSGKSTILEAISYALYGETERLNQRENRGYNMMNLKSNELLIDFIFKAGDTDTEYRFKVTGKRNRNHFERINTFERTAYRREESEWIPIEVESAESIIGLSYDNFRRTVIIPQNKFQEFLQLGDKDRTQMMKELFNLEKFELSRRIISLERKNNDEKLILEDRIKQIGEVEPAQVQTLKEEWITLQKELEKRHQVLSERQQVESAFTQLKELFDRIAIQKNALAQLQAREQPFDELEERIKRYEYCQLHFQGLLDNQRQHFQATQRLQESLEGQRHQLKERSSYLIEEEKTFVQLQLQYNNREALRRKSEELEQIINIVELEGEAETKRERVSKGEVIHSKTLAGIGQLRQQSEQIAATIATWRKDQPDAAERSAISNWFVMHRGLVHAKKELLADAEKAKERLQQLLEKQQQLIRNDLQAIIPANAPEASLAELIQQTGAHRVKLDQQLKTCEEELRQLEIHDQLEKYAHALRPGEPCPLCGSDEHPQMLSASGVKQALASIRQKRQDLQSALQRLGEVEKLLNTLLTQHTGYHETLQDLRQKLEAQEQKIREHRQTFCWNNFDPDQEAEALRFFAEADALQKRIHAEERRMNSIKEELIKEEENERMFRLAITQFREDGIRFQAEADSLKAQFKTLNISEYIHLTPISIAQEAQRVRRQFDQIGYEYQASEKNLSTLKVEIGTLTGSLQTNEQTFSGYQTTAAELAQQLQKRLAHSDYPSLEDVNNVLSSPLDLETEKKRAIQFRQQLHTARVQYHTLAEQAEGKNYDENAHRELLDEIARLMLELNEQKRESIILENKISRLEKDLALHQELIRKLDFLQQRGEDIITLKRMFTASGFVNYVSSVYLQNLCNAANERFYKLTRQKLQLEITDKNDFQIRDFLHNGQVRSVKTLSGGQTFQAALCLALALADNIQQLTQSSQNFFFLDEGFGSLDKESLQIVFDTLKSLRKENRIVGVISHVEEMQHEIDTYLKITNDEVTGSLVQTSWK